MTEVQEFWITLTVDDFDAAVRLYRDALGLPEVAGWSSEQGRVLLLDAGRATLELFDEAQAATLRANQKSVPGSGSRSAWVSRTVDGGTIPVREPGIW